MMSVVDGYNRAGTGSASVTVHGAGMGLVTYTGRAREGQTGCEATEWESETSVRCLESHGGRGTRRVVMTAGERGGSVTQAWSGDVGMMSVIDGSNRGGTGSGSVTVHGAGMGLVRGNRYQDFLDINPINHAGRNSYVLDWYWNHITRYAEVIQAPFGQSS